MERERTKTYQVPSLFYFFLYIVTLVLWVQEAWLPCFASESGHFPKWPRLRASCTRKPRPHYFPSCEGSPPGKSFRANLLGLFSCPCPRLFLESEIVTELALQTISEPTNFILQDLLLNKSSIRSPWPITKIC